MDDNQAREMYRSLEADNEQDGARMSGLVQEIQALSEQLAARASIQSGLLVLHPKIGTSVKTQTAEADRVTRSEHALDERHRPATAEGMSIPSAAILVLEEDPSGWLTPNEITDLLLDRSLISPNVSEPVAATRVAMRRLASKGNVRKRLRSGRTPEYQFVPLAQSANSLPTGLPESWYPPSTTLRYSDASEDDSEEDVIAAYERDKLGLE